MHEDGSGVFDTVLAFEDSFLRLVGETPGADDIFDPESLPPGAVVEDYRQDGFTGARVNVEVPHMELLPQVLAEGGDVSEGVSDLELARDGEGWRFSMEPPPIGGLVADAVAPAGGSLDEVIAVLESASYTVRLALPGEVIEHNADRVEDDELVWELDLTSEQPRTLTARSQPPGGLDDWAILTIGLVGAAALIAAVLLLARRSSRPTPSP